MPRTLGHEIAGTVIEGGADVRNVSVGDRVAIHYLLSCGSCRMCLRAGEQFCESGRMIGKECDGGYAETIVVPKENAIPIPSNVPVEVAAVMICSTAAAFSALRVARLPPGSTVPRLRLGGPRVSCTPLPPRPRARPTAPRCPLPG